MTRMTTMLPDVAHVAVDTEDELRQCWEASQTNGNPVVVVPRRADATLPIARVLLPLDGTAVSSAAVHPLVELLASSGVEIVVLHVFTAATVPRYWDQPVHAAATWKREFGTRHDVPEGARLVLRDGRPGDTVLDVAARESVDLIALGWAGRLDSGRAATVRETVLGAQVPVLLMPVDVPVSGPSPHPSGPTGC